MWLLENAGSAFQGRRLWLRPGKRYLFGRTRAEPGQLVISDKTISRKHLTITVDSVREGDGNNCDSRSVVTIEDLATKIGTLVNGTQIRGQKFVLLQDRNEIKMGHMAALFTIAWRPVVLSFSLSSKQLRGGGGGGGGGGGDTSNSDPWAEQRRDLEPLDIKYLAGHDDRAGTTTTHVVAKKRNTPKGLQALINGKYIVTEAFVAAIVRVASLAPGAGPALESDFDACWPDALGFLPPRGDEPSDRPVSTYAPDPRRAALFDGYTFVFYDAKQYETLLPPIASGRGKALLAPVEPGATEVDDFVRYVKGVAGEPGLGELGDGPSPNPRSVVVVRFVPGKGDHVAWFARFTTAVALRLDHRPIDQREFLDAILAVEPGMLRRPLEVDAAAPASPDAAEPQTQPHTALLPVLSLSQASSRRRARRGAASRFKGFDADLDSDNDNAGVPDTAPVAAASNPAGDEDRMFVSQTDAFTDDAASASGRQPRRQNKRPAATPAGPDEDDVMDDIAPTAAAVKRRRIEAGVAPVPPRGSDTDMDEGEDEGDEDTTHTKKRGGKPGLLTDEDILEQARRNREAAETRLAEERAQLAQLPDEGLDAEAIRRLTIVETVAVRLPSEQDADQNPRDKDMASGRWDPRWNGRRNFKKFRRPGDAVGRPAPRVIVALEPAKTKVYGIGDDYWLGGGGGGGGGGSEDRRENGNGSGDRASLPPASASVASSSRRAGAVSAANGKGGGDSGRVPVDVDADADEDEDEVAGASADAGPDDLLAPDSEPGDDGRRQANRANDDADSLSSLNRPSLSVPSDSDAQLHVQPPPPPPPPPPPSDERSDLPKTRSGKAAARTATRRQGQATSTQVARTAVAAAGAAGSVSSSLALFDTVPPDTPLSVPSTATAGRAKRAAPALPAGRSAPGSTRDQPAKRPRRGGAVAASAATTARSGTQGAVHNRDDDSDRVDDDEEEDDDGLTFRFRSRRR